VTFVFTDNWVLVNETECLIMECDTFLILSESGISGHMWAIIDKRNKCYLIEFDPQFFFL
jgi:hypothetical protein